MQSLKSPYILYNQQSVGSTLHNNLLFITNSTFLVSDYYYFTHDEIPPNSTIILLHCSFLLLHTIYNIYLFPC